MSLWFLQGLGIATGIVRMYPCLYIYMQLGARISLLFLLITGR